MKAIAYDHFGESDVLKLMDLEVPMPEENEVQIHLCYAGVNPVDYKIRQGYFKDVMPHLFPVIPGWEGAGVVTKIGKACQRIKVSDEVYGYFRLPVIGRGAYAEYITVPEEYISLKPKKLTFKEAAGIPLAGLTAWQALFDVAQLKAGQTILIHAAAGGVGGMAVQFASCTNAIVFATASAPNHDYVKRLGADTVIDYTTDSVRDILLAAKPEGVDVVLDCVGADVTARSFDLVKQGGCVISVVDRDVASKAPNGKRGIFVFVAPNAKQLQEIGALVDTDKIISPQITEFALEEAKKAQELIERRHTVGKIVLRV